VQIDNTVLEKLEKLSHLRIDDSKKEEVMEQLTEILGYIENLNELDTDALDAAFSTLEGGTPLREDSPREEPFQYQRHNLQDIETQGDEPL